MRNALFSLTALIGLAAAAPAMAHPIAAATAPLVQTVDWRGYGYGPGYGYGYGRPHYEHDRYREWRRREAYEHWRYRQAYRHGYPAYYRGW